MNDLVDAFKRGVKNAEIAETNRKEIESLFAELSEAVVRGSEGRIASVELEDVERFAPDMGIHVIDPSKPFPGRKIKYLALVARASGTSNGAVELCEVGMGVSAYPVTLTYAKRDVRCVDAKALRKELSELLQHSETGRALNSLMQQ